MEWYKLSETLPEMEQKEEREVEDHIVIDEISHVTEEYSYPVLLRSKNMYKVTKAFYGSPFDVMVGRVCRYTSITKSYNNGEPKVSVLISLPGIEAEEIEVIGENIHSYYFDKCFGNVNDIEWACLDDEKIR